MSERETGKMVGRTNFAVFSLSPEYLLYCGVHVSRDSNRLFIGLDCMSSDELFYPHAS